MNIFIVASPPPSFQRILSDFHTPPKKTPETHKVVISATERQMNTAHMYNACQPGLLYLRKGPAQTVVGWTPVKGEGCGPSRAEVGRVLASAV